MKIIILFLILDILLSPLYIIRWSYFNILPTTLLELLIWLTLLSWAIYKLVKKEKLKFDFEPKIAFGLIILSLITSVWIASDKLGALGILRAYFIEPMLLYVVVLDILKSKPDLKLNIFSQDFSVRDLVWNSYFLSGLWLAILGVIQYFFHVLIVTDHQWDRAHGVFNNANALALFIGPIIAVEWARFVRKRDVGKWKWLGLAVLIVAFLATKSLSGYIALLAVILIASISPRLGVTRFIKYAYLAGFAVFFLFLLNIGRFTPKVDNPWVRPGGTLQVRLCVWEGTIELIKDNLLFGAGIRGFQDLYSSSYTTCDAEPLVYPHNILLNFWSEIGLFGVLGFGYLIYSVLARKFNQYTYFFLSFLLHGLADVPYFKNDLALIFWVILALSRSKDK